MLYMVYNIYDTISYYYYYFVTYRQVKMAVHDIWLLSMTDYTVISKGKI